MGALRLRGGRRNGFTLLEVLVGLALGSLVLSGASAAFLALSGQAERLARQGGAVDHRANAERVLRLVAGNLRVAGGSSTVEGDRQSVALRSWCDAPGSGLFPCWVRIRAEVSPTGTVLVLQTAEGDAPSSAETVEVELWRAGAAGLRYLLDPAGGGTWADTWTMDLTPWALGIVSDGDTLILPLGAR